MKSVIVHKSANDASCINLLVANDGSCNCDIASNIYTLPGVDFLPLFSCFRESSLIFCQTSSIFLVRVANKHLFVLFRLSRCARKKHVL